MNITVAQLKEYTTRTATPKRWKCYDDSVKLYKDLKTHADGEFPAKLIDKRRPSESIEIKEYRKEIYEAITEGTFSKILTSLAKIRKASDWSIKYDQTAVSSKIIEDETPESYFEKKFPYFESLSNWTFNVGLKNYLIDANAVIVVMPLEIGVPNTSYLRPFPFIYNSDNVYDFQEEQFCVLYSTDKSTYGEGTAKKFDGDIYYVVTDERIQRYDQINANGDLELKVDYPHQLGYMPAFRMKGIFKKALDKTIMWKSRISSIVHGLNEAAREYSDLQAEVVQHIHSTMWMYATQDCVECRGFGQVQREGRTVKCDVCNGQGKYNASPYAHQVIRPPQVGEKEIPNPPMGYVEKQVDIVKIQDDRVDKHIYKALASINMEFLAESPLNQSGVAKAVDQDELNVFVNSIASDIVAIMKTIMRMCIDYRYRMVVPVATQRKDLIPQFNIPEKFDLLSSNMLIQDIKAATEGKVDPSILNEMNVDYASKKFIGKPDVMALVKLILQLDPFPGVTEEDKMSRMQNSGISKVDYVVSSNIYQFIKRAIAEDEKFVTLDYDDQREQLEEYAQEIIDDNDAAAKLRMQQQQLALQQQAPSTGPTTVNGGGPEDDTGYQDPDKAQDPGTGDKPAAADKTGDA